VNIAAAESSAVTKKNDAPAPMFTSGERPVPAVRANVTAHSATRPTPRPIAACAAARPRVICPDRNSSQRPASSSPRNTRVAISRPQMAPKMMTLIPAL
jgi:hypothetical protein